MRVLVTGAAGRIGAAIVRQLRERHTVLTTDCRALPGIDVVADLGDPTALAPALEGIDALVHCAALHAPQVGICADAEFWRVNVEATASLVDRARRAGVAQMVYTSTTALYGAASEQPDRAVWIDETTPPQPRTVYHHSKLAAEQLLQAASGPSFRVRLLRMSRCFPEALPLMATYRLHRGVDARDVARAHELALDSAGPACATFVISASTPFVPEDAPALKAHAERVIARRAPALARAFAERGWALPTSIDRVYCSAMALVGLGWRSEYGFEAVLGGSDD